MSTAPAEPPGALWAAPSRRSLATWLEKEMIRLIESVLGQDLPRCTAQGVPPYREVKKTIKGRAKVRRRLR